MLLLDLQLSDTCFCGSLQGLRQQASKALAGAWQGSEEQRLVALLGPGSLPDSLDLPSRLAAALMRLSRGSRRQAAVGAVAGPVLALLLGFADGLGQEAAERSRLAVSLRRELRQLLRAIGAKAAIRVVLVNDPDVAEARMRSADVFDLLLAWCSAPLVPTYGYGLCLGRGDVLEGPSWSLASDLAWVLRLACARSRVDPHGGAPMLAAAAEALCSPYGPKTAEALRAALGLRHRTLRRVTFSAAELQVDVAEKEDSDDFHRAVSDDVFSGGKRFGQ